MTTFYETLYKETETQRYELYNTPLVKMAMNGDITVDIYIKYLTQAYHHVKHTIPFLMTMGSKLGDDKGWVQKVLAEYIEEEVGHEEWILNDIESAGGDKDLAKKSINLETQVMNSYNYDWLNRINPMAFFGMIFMLESTSVEIATQAGESIQENLGLPKKAFSYLYSHGSLDIQHMEFFKQQVNKITDEQDKADIIKVAQDTFILFANVLRSVTK